VLDVRAAPAVTNVQTPNLARSGGAVATVSGVNFGTVDATVTSSVVSIGACSTSAWTSVTAVQCVTSAYTGAVFAVAVTVSGLVGTRSGTVLSFDGTFALSTPCAAPRGQPHSAIATARPACPVVKLCHAAPPSVCSAGGHASMEAEHSANGRWELDDRGLVVRHGGLDCHGERRERRRVRDGGLDDGHIAAVQRACGWEWVCGCSCDCKRFCGYAACGTDVRCAFGDERSPGERGDKRRRLADTVWGQLRHGGCDAICCAREQRLLDDRVEQ
jgi:hypothetical protein